MSTKGTAITKRCDSTCRHTASVESFALNHRLNTRTSDDGTRVIVGRYGHVFQFDDHLLGVIVTPNPPRKRYWGCVRAEMLKARMTLVQNGDGEGSAVFDSNNPIQAKLAIRAAGIRRRRQLTPEQREKRIAFLPPRSGIPHSGAGVRRKPREVEKARSRRTKRPRTVRALGGGE